MKNARTIGILLLFLAAFLGLQFVAGVPVGPTIGILSNSTISSNPQSRADAGGYIFYTSISATQQDYAWKAYVGNVSGSFTLDDANGKTIYDWTVNSTQILGEIYATRNNSILWTWINCSNNSVLLNETGFFGMGIDESDNINNTFNYTAHKVMQTATSTMPASSCPALYTFVNDTRQASSTSAKFQELLLMDSQWHQIYATFVEQDQFNYQGSGSLTDFQMILPENKTLATPTTYYFYVEIG